MSVLEPKAILFNEFLQLEPDRYADMHMWHWDRDVRSADYTPGPIPPERVKVGVFVFLGKLWPIDRLDYELILDDFDRLLPLYCYVESNGQSKPISTPTGATFSFQPGCSVKEQWAVATYAQSQFDVSLRHNVLQQCIYKRLESQFGADNVGTENPSGIGRLDLVVRRPEGYWFYEIKTADSPRACIREAIGQLLEYAFWPGGQEACRLIVLGESAIDREGKEYLRWLRKRFALPIEYEQIVV